jgi:protein gp37
VGEKTGISWTDSTWNPIRGCSRVSEGCRNCYAESVAHRFSGPGQPYEGLAVLKNGHASWTGRVEFVEDHLMDPIRWKRPRRIFVNSMSDLFHENVTDEMRDKIFSVMALCPQHIFQVLTKRPERMLEYLTGEHKARNEEMTTAKGECSLAFGRPARFFPQAFKKLPLNQDIFQMKWPLPHVWQGVSVEDARVKHRIDILREVPAVVRFLSIEPLIGDVGLLDLKGISWVIVGGESGPGARPMMSQWADSIREQCEAAGVAYYFKQNGEWVDAGHSEFGKLPASERRALHSDGTEWDLGDMPEDDDADVTTMVRVGRKRSGDTLYGKVYHAFPETR